MTQAFTVETCKNINKMNYFKNNQAIALIMVIMFMTLILFMAIYFLNFSLTEDKISRSQSWGAKTYYLSEAGIAEMVWRLKNNPTYKDSFETNPTWTETFVHNDPFGPGSGSYSVTITNSGLARGEIEATGSIDIGGKSSQRIVKTYVYRALETEEIDISTSTTFSDNQTAFSLSRINIMNGSAHSNADLDVQGASTINIDYDLKAVNIFTKSSFSTVNVGGNIYDNSGSYPPQPDSVDMPPVSFDTDGDPNSLKARADVIYTEAEFQALIDSSPNPMVLNDEITYVTGDIVFEGDPDVIINGLLVSDGSITIGKVRWFFFIPYCKDGEHTSFTINHATGSPSGLIVKNDIEFELCTSDSNIGGVLYAADKVDIMSFTDDMDIVGAVIARNISIIGIWQPIDITYSNNFLLETLGATEFSPIITVEHWEEEY